MLLKYIDDNHTFFLPHLSFFCPPFPSVFSCFLHPSFLSWTLFSSILYLTPSVSSPAHCSFLYPLTLPSSPCQHKQRCPVLEEQLVDLVVYAMERSETEEHFDADIGGTSQLLWQHLSSQLIFFVLFQFASFPHMVLSLHQKVREEIGMGKFAGSSVYS